MDKNRIEQLLEDSIPSIIENLKKELQQSVSYDVKNVLQAEITKQVKDWYSENLAAEIKAILDDNRSGLITIAPTICNGIQDQIATAITGQIEETLSQSWGRSALFKALLGN